MKKTDRPIGFYDSGVGGVSVLRETVKLLPHENYIYYGDNANAPYGRKSEDEIRELSFACGEFLFQKGVKMIVIACNTATSIVVQGMREKYNIPIISMEPAVKPAMEAREAGDIVVMATPATLRQKRYHALLERLDARDRVTDLECDGLAALVEQGELASPQIDRYLRNLFAPLRERESVGAIVIGCTHYSFISETIHNIAKEVLNGDCAVYDGMFGTARQVKSVLEEEGLLNRQEERGSIKFFSSLESHNGGELERFFNI